MFVGLYFTLHMHTPVYKYTKYPPGSFGKQIYQKYFCTQRKKPMSSINLIRTGRGYFPFPLWFLEYKSEMIEDFFLKHCGFSKNVWEMF